MIKRILLVVLTILTFSAHAETCTISDASKIDEMSHKVLHDFDSVVAGCTSGFGPSGIVYHPGIDRLIVISDKGGQYATMKTDGSEVVCKDISGAGINDYEGITYADPQDGFIYVGLESGDEAGVAFIHQVDLESSSVANTWKISFPGGVVGNDGLESLTFVRDTSHREGGTFYVGDQTAAKVVGKCEIPIKSGGDTDVLYGCSVEMQPGFEEVSGLDYLDDAVIKDQHGVIFLSSDSDNKIAAYARDGTFLDWARAFPKTSGPGQEGHALLGCNLFISSDANDRSRKIHHYRFSPES